MNMGKSETPWPVFRLGEIYLNLAEAAMELNKSSEALDAVNKIRERAGIALLSNINMEKDPPRTQSGTGIRRPSLLGHEALENCSLGCDTRRAEWIQRNGFVSLV